MCCYIVLKSINHNPRVGSSNLSSATIFSYIYQIVTKDLGLGKSPSKFAGCRMGVIWHELV